MWLKTFLALCILLVGCTPTIPTMSAPTPPAREVSYMDAVVAAEAAQGSFHPQVLRQAVLGHIAFIEAHSTLRYRGEPLPFIEVWPPWLIMEQGGSEALALYDKGVMVLPAYYRHDEDRALGMLLHEVVHYLQEINGVEYSWCYRHAEVLAYNISNQWVAAQPSYIKGRMLAPRELIKDAARCDVGAVINTITEVP